MKEYTIGLGIARINGIEKNPYYFEQKKYFAWKISFTKVSTVWLKNLPFIYLGNTIEEANKKVQEYRNNFNLAKIYEDEMVAVMFDINDQNEIIAISALGRKNWIDIVDDFKLKKFRELNMEIESIIVY